MNGIDASANNRPSVTGTPKIRKPASIANSRPQNRPNAVADRLGQTTITVTSCNCDGATPATGCFMVVESYESRVESQILIERTYQTRRDLASATHSRML